MYYIHLRDIPIVATPPKKTKLSHNNIYLKFKEVLEEKKSLLCIRENVFCLQDFNLAAVSSKRKMYVLS